MLHFCITAADQKNVTEMKDEEMHYTQMKRETHTKKFSVMKLDS